MWEEFRSVADFLHSDQVEEPEATHCYRSSVSRSYYAAFTKSLSFLKAHDNKFCAELVQAYPKPLKNLHSRVIDALECHDEVASRLLRKLKRRRTEADYKNRSCSENFAYTSLALRDQVIQAVEALEKK